MSRLLQTFMSWVVVYPLITTLLWVGEPFLSALALPLRTLIVTVILVPVMSYVAMPLMLTLMARVNGH